MRSQFHDIFLALADPTRRAILQRLAFGHATVTQLALPYRMTMQAVCKHLRVLERAGLIRKEKSGRERVIFLEGAPLRELHRWTGEFREIWKEGPP
ncbi:MAG: metalloregulator ArsR/SmtB family transcription factor [Candidatus Hydrogenedentes bacterium]|nr:metalloregulator ArsR/SmtB family transcription factor [Candidatus Hydrogenedentota bacterium]